MTPASAPAWLGVAAPDDAARAACDHSAARDHGLLAIHTPRVSLIAAGESPIDRTAYRSLLCALHAEIDVLPLGYGQSGSPDAAKTILASRERELVANLEWIRGHTELMLRPATTVLCEDPTEHKADDPTVNAVVSDGQNYLASRRRTLGEPAPAVVRLRRRYRARLASLFEHCAAWKWSPASQRAKDACTVHVLIQRAEFNAFLERIHAVDPCATMVGPLPPFSFANGTPAMPAGATQTL